MEEEKKEEQSIDPLEFAPEVDIAAKFDQAWIDAVSETKKWDEKKAKYEELADACKNVKIKPGNFDGIVSVIKKDIGAVNVNIAMGAVKAASSLAKGLNTGFNAHVKDLLTPILNKMKEKKP